MLNNDESRMMALTRAIADSNIELVKRYIDEGALLISCGYPPLLTAVIDGNFDMVKVFVEYGNVNIDMQDDNGCTALMLSLYNGDVDSSTYLLEKGANVTIRDICGWNALFSFSMMRGKIYLDKFSLKEILKILLSSCDPNLIDDEGFTAFDHFTCHWDTMIDYDFDSIWMNAGIDITEHRSCPCTIDF